VKTLSEKAIIVIALGLRYILKGTMSQVLFYCCYECDSNGDTFAELLRMIGVLQYVILMQLQG
jgi:hypothetical protein